ncbi:hypothetical protein DUNSADRAFT_12228 [Dunaliella salina]|nr:hypothetical protein DUNSADRAFT_12228 [Dunaliella salina]|eukprot:KAF5832048.1 hypothetical protein DUNSADRAFT_12228 [Dunaliella salina]
MSDCYIGLDQQYTLQLLPRQPPKQPASNGTVSSSGWDVQPTIAAPSFTAPDALGGKEGGGMQDSMESRRARRAAMAAERAAERQRDAQLQLAKQQQPEGASKGWGAGSAVALGTAREGEQLTEVEWDDEPSCA